MPGPLPQVDTQQPDTQLPLPGFPLEIMPHAPQTVTPSRRTINQNFAVSLILTYLIHRRQSLAGDLISWRRVASTEFAPPALIRLFIIYLDSKDARPGRIRTGVSVPGG